MKTSHFPKKERNILLSPLPPSFWPLAHSAVALAHNPQDVAMAAAPPAAQGIAGIVYTALPSPAIIYHGNISSLPPPEPTAASHSLRCRSLKGSLLGRPTAPIIITAPPPRSRQTNGRQTNDATAEAFFPCSPVSHSLPLSPGFSSFQLMLQPR